MTSEESVRCTNCGQAMPGIAIQLRALREQNEHLLEMLDLQRRFDSELRRVQAYLKAAERELGHSLDNSVTYFVASSQREVFHRPECEYAQLILDSNNLVEFYSHEQAVEAGYKPCKTFRA